MLFRFYIQIIAYLWHSIFPLSNQKRR